MKKHKLIFILSILLASAFNLSAQTFTTDLDTSKGYWIPGGYLVEMHIKANSTSSASVVIDWKVINFQKGAGWTFDGLCDNVDCKYESTTGLLDGTTTFTTNPVSGLAKADFKVDFNGDAAAVGTKSSITIDMTSGTTNKKGTFVAYKTSTGIVTTFRNDDEITIFPNPASNYIDVLYSQSSDVKSITIYNLIGKVVNVYKVTNKNSARCEFNTDMPSGIYFVRIADSKGNIIATRKITHQ